MKTVGDAILGERGHSRGQNQFALISSVRQYPRFEDPLISHAAEKIIPVLAHHRPSPEGLVPLPFEYARYPRTIGVLTRKDAVLPPLAPRFMELLVRFASSDA